MRKAITVALAAYLLLYLLPLAALGDNGRVELPAEEDPSPVPSLRIDRPVSSTGGMDAARTVRVAMKDGTVEELAMDEYLWGVVAAEMPASFEPEALKAQAIAARTYTVARQGRVRDNHPDAEICTDVTCCQAWLTREGAAEKWGEAAAANGEKITRAVSETDGLVILYEGQPIQAVFFSSAAGETVDAVEVWGSQVPYLTGVTSPEGDEVPNYHTRVTVDAKTFRDTLLAEYPELELPGGPEDWLEPSRCDPASGASSVTIGGMDIPGTRLRALFGLRSASFELAPEGEVLVFSVTGYGHGVGMSQYGANAMAKEGKDCREILTWYYTGVTVEPCPLW